MIAIVTSLGPLIHLVLGVLVGLVICICLELLVGPGKIMTCIRLLVALVVVAYGLRLFGIAA